MTKQLDDDVIARIMVAEPELTWHGLTVQDFVALYQKLDIRPTYRAYRKFRDLEERICPMVAYSIAQYNGTFPLRVINAHEHAAFITGYDWGVNCGTVGDCDDPMLIPELVTAIRFGDAVRRALETAFGIPMPVGIAALVEAK